MGIRAAKDGREGWVTIQGSRGTIFLEADTQYKVERPVPLRTTLTPGSKIVRQMAEGEVFKAAGPPQEYRPPTTIGIRVRARDDHDVVGWVLYSSGESPSLQM